MLLALGVSGLLSGLWGGLARLGWAVPAADLALLHGPLMVSGFFGTLISLERAVALGAAWPYAAPMLAGLGTLAALAGAPPAVMAAATAGAGLVLVAGSLVVFRRHPAGYTAILLLGALCWVAGTVFWAAEGTADTAASWWLAFLVLTIVAERLELSRLMRPSRTAQGLLLAAAAALPAGIALAPVAGGAERVSGAALLFMTGWLLRHDIARRTVRTAGQTRFAAACMLSAYFWLAATGVFHLAEAGGDLALGRDALLHTAFIGFVLPMVFGHAAIILPAVARLPIRYTPAFYAPLVLLHLSLALRIASDLAVWIEGRAWSGWATVAALVAFALTILRSSRRAAKVQAGTIS